MQKNCLCLGCAFYAIFTPNNVTLGVEISSVNDPNHVEGHHYGNNTDPLGAASGYLQISGAGCAGCCDLSAAFDGKSACSSQGVFNSAPPKTTTKPPVITTKGKTTTIMSKQSTTTGISDD